MGTQYRSRAGAWKITVREWIDRWLGTQDVGISTTENREYLIRRFIRPAWGASALNSLGTEEIAAWENGLPTRAGISRRTAREPGACCAPSWATRPPPGPR